MGGDNYGMYQSGSGRMDNSGPMAVGSGARATTHTGGATGDPALPSPQEALAELRALLAEHGRQLPAAGRAQARGEVEEVADELDADEPHRGRLSEALDRLAAALGPVAVLTSAAETLRAAVTRFLG